MKRILLIFAMAGCLGFAAPPAEAARPQGIPAGAEKMSETRWRYKDPKGVSWLYFVGPFGVSKTEEKAFESLERERAKAPAPSSNMKVASSTADTVTFEMQGPVGKQKWTRKRSELTPEEKSVVDAASKSASASEVKE
jgi:hypothetical protein